MHLRRVKTHKAATPLYLACEGHPLCVHHRDQSADAISVAAPIMRGKADGVACLRAGIAQCLLRRLCPSCATSAAPTPAEAAHFERHHMTVPATIKSPVGCADCGHSGYAGRLGVFEMTEIGETLRAAIDRGASEIEFTQIGLREDQTLISQARLEVAGGATSLAEALRVVGDGA